MKLRGGVLFIGSLLWQDDIKINNKDGERKKFRGEKLNLDSVQNIRVPIRYGRFSTAEGKAYTMIYDFDLPPQKWGTAKSIGFQNDPMSLEDIILEGHELSRIEGGETQEFIKGEMKPWCVVSILINPSLSSDDQIAISIVWKNELEKNKVGYSTFLIENKLFGVNKNAIMDLWSEELKNYDFILTTSTRPEIRKSAILNTPEITRYIGNRDYFFENIGRGIRTHQDQDIIATMIANWPQSDEVKSEIIDYVFWACGYYASCEDYYKSLNFKMAIKKAGEAFVPPKTRNCLGKKGSFASHQNRIGKEKCKLSAKELLHTGRLKRLSEASDFAEIFKVTEEVRTRVFGLGHLWSYDTAQRIAMHKGIKPDAVYLQSGALDGAELILERRVLRENRRKKRTIERDDLPEYLKLFPPFLIENLLCVGKRKKWFLEI